jgi:predicted lysophospholipase L1 biosynthesis ABC-type transport system permease subunit
MTPAPSHSPFRGQWQWPLPLRLLRQRKAAALAFVIFYGLGLAVYLWVDGLWRRVDSELSARGQDLLESDIQIESRRPFTEAESTWVAAAMPPGTKRAQALGFLSMVATSQNDSRLVQIKATDSAYPLFGHFVFDTTITPGFTLEQWKTGEVLAPHGLLAALRLKVGDSVSIGARRRAARQRI